MGRLIDEEDVVKAIDIHTFDTDKGLCLDDDITCILEELPSYKRGKMLTVDEEAMIEFAENVLKVCALLLMNEGGKNKTAFDSHYNFDFHYKDDGKLYRMMVKEIGEKE